MRLQDILQPVQPLLELTAIARLVVSISCDVRAVGVGRPTLSPGFFLSLYSHRAPLRLHHRHEGCPRSHFTYGVV